MRNRPVTATPDHAAQDRPSPPNRQTSAIPPAAPALMRQRLAVTPPERYRRRLWCQARVSPPSTVRRQDRLIASAQLTPYIRTRRQVYTLAGRQWQQSNVSVPSLSRRAERADVPPTIATTCHHRRPISMLLFAWLIFDFPEHATRQPGVFCALISAAITAFSVADYRPLRGAPWFPPIKPSEPARAGSRADSR